jgi:hypothetical protein
MAMVAALAGAAISGGSNMVSSLGTAGIQAGSGMIMQDKDQKYNDTVINRAVQSYTKYNLPEFNAFQSGNNNQMPATKFSLGGGNYFHGGPVGSNLPVFTTPYQQYFHQGTPNKPPTPSPTARFNRSGNGGDGSVTFNIGGREFAGQNDRLGIGNGRYSATPPPLHSYNSVSSQTNNFNNSVGVQANFNSRGVPTITRNSSGLTVRNSFY